MYTIDGRKQIVKRFPNLLNTSPLAATDAVSGAGHRFIWHDGGAHTRSRFRQSTTKNATVAPPLRSAYVHRQPTHDETTRSSRPRTTTATTTTTTSRPRARATGVGVTTLQWPQQQLPWRAGARVRQAAADPVAAPIGKIPYAPGRPKRHRLGAVRRPPFCHRVSGRYFNRF